ncbi:MAG: GT4 family glycosyltransferase PelF [Candidatus Omnitrophota bacterium]|jgi:glycosyltransferase involved in cell wall biosynthesis
MNDVCLLLEGTYPYVAGGVSGWVHTLVRELRDIRFSIVYLGAHRTKMRKLHYDIPPNVTDFREIYLFDYRVQPEKTKKRRPGDYKILREFLRRMRHQDTSLFEDLLKTVADPGNRTISLYDLAHSREAWCVIEEMYRSEDRECSFLDYFWTWRFLYLPLFSLLRAPLPEARVYHSVSTGYAGVLGALAKIRYGRPYLLTEHGIYTRERKIEIAKADWIHSDQAARLRVLEGGDFFKDWWTSLFTFCSLLAYQRSDEIITLYEANRKIQIEEGADPAKTRIIPNGVRIDPDVLGRPAREPSAKPRIGFVGRVVPIKDVKTFIMACRKIAQEIPEVEIDIIGPTDEDEEYFKECQLLVKMQSLENTVKFVGKAAMKDCYPRLDLIVLTSISEAQPLVILEAGVYGIPVVATEVGSCAELLQGRSADDRLLGASGLVTPVCDPEATADAVIRLLKDRSQYRRMSEAAKRRVAAYYREDDMVASYEELYNRYAGVCSWPA